MNPEDVPAELVQKAEAIETTYMYDNAGTGKGDSEDRLRAVLAAVLPEVARGVRSLPSTAPTIQGKGLKAWYTTAQNALQEARRWKETSREKDVKDLETKVRCLEAVVRVSKGARDVARKQERRYKAEVERLNVAARDLLAVVREVAGLHRPGLITCLNPMHDPCPDPRSCGTCDTAWPCPTARAVQALTETTEEPNQ